MRRDDRDEPFLELEALYLTKGGTVAVLVIAAVFVALVLLVGCATCQPIIKKEFVPYPVPVERPCQKPEIPPPPVEPVIPAGTSEADGLLIFERSWEATRAWGLNLWKLFVAMPGETVKPLPGEN